MYIYMYSYTYLYMYIFTYVDISAISQDSGTALDLTVVKTPRTVQPPYLVLSIGRTNISTKTLLSGSGL